MLCSNPTKIGYDLEGSMTLGGGIAHLRPEMSMERRLMQCSQPPLTHTLRPPLRKLFAAILLLSVVLGWGSAAWAQPEPQETKPASATSLSVGNITSNIGWYYLAPFGLASFIALWFGIERIVILRRGRVIPRAFVDRFLQHLEQGKLDPTGALNLCEENRSPVAQVFAHGVRKWGKPSVEVEQAIIDGGERQVSQLRKHLRVLNGVATVTPLMGLLGTVIGMIIAFDKIAGSEAMGNARELGFGIAMALLTTALGLLVAIPTLILYLYLTGRVDALVMDMDLLAQDVVHLISHEALSAESVATSRSTTRGSTAKKKAV